ncbi:atrial natriuretic peptide receptor 1-like [Paramacrobiotus metropolitanus]|uniref:atrial natriuretic peptide receptor 1-like n=1 Tax=Paramacrobiotus metropolitanus TaxID=2943436 RepID=UPI0024455F75|nr:atrial natriuretic peptide receptor 1-like [Paramacrobiotus metropolitanus]
MWPVRTYVYFSLLLYNSVVNLLAADDNHVVFLSIHSYSTLIHSLGYVGPAIDMGLLYARNTYTNLNFSLVTFMKPSVKLCTTVQAEALPLVADYYYTHHLDLLNNRTTVILATACSDALPALGDFARENNIPIITTGGTDSHLDSRERFPTLLRLLPYLSNELGEVTAALLAYFGWTDVTIIGDDGATELNTFAILNRELPQYMYNVNAGNLTSVHYLHYNFVKYPLYDYYLREASRYSRVFIVITHGSRLRHMLAAAEQMGMTAGEHVFIAFEPFKSPRGFGRMTWEYGDELDNQTRKAYQSLLLISTLEPETNASRSLLNEMINRSLKDYDQIYDLNEPVIPFVREFYQGVIMISRIISEALNEYGTISAMHSVNMARLAWDRWFTTPLGTFHVNSNGDLDNNYAVSGLVPGGNDFQAVLKWDKEHREFSRIGDRQFDWPNNGTPPSNRPPCGFDGKDPKCLNTGFTAAWNTAVEALTIILLLLIAGILSTVFVIRYKKTRKPITGEWMISMDELTPVTYTTFDSLASSNFRARVSRHTDMFNMQILHMMTYRGTIVWVRRQDNKEHKDPSHIDDLRKQINLRKSLRHQNVADFIGVCFDQASILTISEYFPRGGIDKLIQDRDKPIDPNLQLMLLYDCAQGLAYIHRCATFHGSLSTATCMLTPHFSVKLTDFGLPVFYKCRVELALRQGQYEKLFWTAPELLRHPRSNPTSASDVYAFGIVMYEVMFLTKPYYVPDGDTYHPPSLSEKEIISRIKSSSSPYMRPEMSIGKVSIDLKALIEECWRQTPIERPTIDEVVAILTSSLQGSCERSYVDNLIWRLQTLAADLENEVNQRTQNLQAEKERSENLLRGILPRSVANCLLRGETVLPESFESATVAFTGIWEFAALTAHLTPLGIVALLNDLYVCMDNLLPLYDVYKVETIKDTYMLTSGVPERNGQYHVFQVASLCCAFLEAVRTQQFAGCRIRLQIGIQCGPLVAGVIGNKMLRFCLFGDTVNCASRMASTSEPQRIQTTVNVKDVLVSAKGFILPPVDL